MSQEIHIVHLYPNEMNTYGDRGNLLTLQKRSMWHGFTPVLHYYHIGDTLPKQVDILLGGGGQDSAQQDIQNDILRIGDTLHALSDAMVPMLLVCGTYQLFGHHFITHDGSSIQGIGIFNIETVGGSQRLIGNAAVKTTTFGTLYGFENHSGRTYLGEGQEALGTVIRGSGNNGEDATEGARTNNVIGTYLHGPILPSNPLLADGLLALSLQRHNPTFVLNNLDDTLVTKSRMLADDRSY